MAQRERNAPMKLGYTAPGEQNETRSRMIGDSNDEQGQSSSNSHGKFATVDDKPAAVTPRGPSRTSSVMSTGRLNQKKIELEARKLASEIKLKGKVRMTNTQRQIHELKREIVVLEAELELLSETPKEQMSREEKVAFRECKTKLQHHKLDLQEAEDSIIRDELNAKETIQDILDDAKCHAELLDLEEEVDQLDEDERMSNTDPNDTEVKNWLNNQKEVQPFKFDDDGGNGEMLNPRAQSFIPIQQNPPIKKPVVFREETVKPNQGQNEFVNSLASALSQTFGNRGNGIDRKLPSFDGNPCEWGTFFCAFERTTAKYKFDNAENMTRLQESVKGNAKKTVEHLMANVNNVPTIINTLYKRYGQPEYVLDYLVEKAKLCRTVEFHRPETLIEFGNAVEALYTNICAYKEEDYLTNKQLVTELIRKLPGLMRDKWFEWRVEDPTRKTNLLYFHRWLQVRVEAALLQIRPTAGNEQKRDNWRQRRGPAAQAYVTSEDKKTECGFCHRSGHSIDKCYSFARKNYDEKWSYVREQKLCFVCLDSGHNSNHCKSPVKCDKNNCTRNHHPLLHRVSKPPDKKTGGDNSELKSAKPQPKKPKPDEDKNINNVAVSVVKGTDGALPILPVILRGPNGTKKVYAMLDNGATTSLIEKDLVTQLGLEGKQSTFTCRGFGGHLTEDTNAEIVTLDIGGVYRGARFFELKNVVSVDRIGVQPYSLNMEEARRKWPQLKKMRCGSMTKVIPQIIIGSKHRHLTVPREILCSDLDGPVASRSILGWVLEGDLKEENRLRSVYLMQADHNLDSTMDGMMREYFQVENFGIKPVPPNCSVQDKCALEILGRTTNRVGELWETGLLWKEENPTMNDGEEVAKRRLWILEKEFQKKPELKKAYAEKIGEYLKKNYARKLTKDEINVRNGKTRYLPHFGVTNVNKPGKIRIVFDAASKVDGLSLNDYLLTGPDLLQRQTKVLWNFRRHRFVICGDIEDMFSRIKIIPEDVNSQRFLYRNDVTGEVETYAMVVMIFGSKCSPASAIFVLRKNASEFSSIYPAACQAIEEDVYMDDVLTGDDTVEATAELRKNITWVNQQGGFSTKKWITNNHEITATIPEELRQTGSKSMNEKSTIPYERLLGLWWDPEEDEFTFRTNFQKIDPEIVTGKHPTKREMLRLVMSIYDPLGFISQYRVKGLVILQNVWRSGTDWDELVTNEVYEAWKVWISELQNITQVRIPRRYCDEVNHNARVELHTFVDASEEAYAAVSYYRIIVDEKISVSLVGSKVRVASLKKMTIPRLELQAAVLGCLLANTIKVEIKLKVDQFYFWSDSSTVLCWIRSESSRFKEFVANRIGAIQEQSNVGDWYWVPTLENVADDATRAFKPTEFNPTARWYTGPSFLQSKDGWPFEDLQKPKENESESVALIVQNEDAPVKDIADVPADKSETVNDCVEFVKRFSSYTNLLRVAAIVCGVSRKWLNLIRRASVDICTVIDPELLELGELFVIRLVQADAFKLELDALRKSGSDMEMATVGKKSQVSSLSPFLDKFRILRAKGRIDRADWIDEGQRRPILLPAKHHVTDLIIDLEHKRCAHTGQNTVLNNLRQKYWIINGRQAVKRSWTRCGTCRFDRAKPVEPLMADLPTYRLKNYQPAFTYTGVDYFGPVGVTVGRRHEKRWGVLFCCLVTRGVHLEVAYGLSTDEFIMALTRFISTRGRPYMLVSDNGTNFRGAATELKDEVKKLDFQAVMKKERFNGIRHNFMPPAAPHMGGVYERLVQSVKKVLANILKEKYPKDSTLLTIMKEAEFIINSRPLTYVSSDINDDSALTPNHFLRGATDRGPAVPALPDDRSEFLRTNWKYAQLLAKRFWERWTREYLPEIMTREKWTERTQAVEVGDIVILVDDQAPRNCWARGVITATFPGRDGVIRKVEVTKRDFDTKKTTTYTRPVVKVCPTGLKIEKTDVTTSALGPGNVGI